MEVTTHVTREEGLSGKWWWVAEIEPGGGATQARRLDQPAAGVREVVILRDDLDHSRGSAERTAIWNSLAKCGNNISQAARELGVAKVVHTSTSEVYGTARFVPITEEHPLQGQSPYSASKIGADQIAMSFYNAFDTPVSVIRPFNTYGPRQSARAIIPTVITQIASGQRSIKLGALHPTRDFNFVADTVQGFVAVAQSEKSIGEVINIGSNFEISIGDTVALIADIMGVKIEIETDEIRLRPEKSEVDRLWAANDKARDLTGWTPSYAGNEGFRRGLQETVTWFTNPDNLKNYKAGIYNV